VLFPEFCAPGKVVFTNFVKQKVMHSSLSFLRAAGRDRKILLVVTHTRGCGTMNPPSGFC